MRNKIGLFISLLLATFGFSRVALADKTNEAEFCSKGIEQMIEKKIGDYRIIISYANDRMCQRFDLLKREQIVFHEEGIDNHYFLGGDDSNKHFLRKLTGHSTQLVVKRWTGGAHCCTSLLIFDLGREFRKIAEIYGGNFDPKIIYLDHDGISEIRIMDDFLAYRFSSFAYSATADVVLRYTNGHYSVAPEFMKKPVPSQRALDAKIPLWEKLLRKKNASDWPAPPLIQTLTDLIYTGNKKVAFDLLDRAWPADVAGKADFLKSYQEALNESKYYAEFERKL
ncbi:MAG: hypothetical protein HY537_09095 [Deltaproteobacteria bacterium]|nr:hypothetical protein [Deltaproteobacteria bacterium]